jgi:hypothetical protein
MSVSVYARFTACFGSLLVARLLCLSLCLSALCRLCIHLSVIMSRRKALEKRKNHLQFGEYLRVRGIQHKPLGEFTEQVQSGRSNQCIQKERVS